jgi:hypothetical protein
LIAGDYFKCTAHRTALGFGCCGAAVLRIRRGDRLASNFYR